MERTVLVIGAGINNKVMIVANNKPIIIASAKGSHIIPPPRYRGIKP